MKGVKIKEIKEIASGSYELSFKREFEFIPGQVIGINTGDEQAERLYSIASGNREKDIRILFTLKDDGYLTPRLAASRPGTIIQVSEPFGSFTCDEKDAFWIASGTGIAPFASMIFSGISAGNTLIHGGRFLSHFYYRKEITGLMKKNYVPCCSGETGEGVYPGRLTQYLENLEKLPAGKKYYLCGSAEMVVDTRDILIRRGIPYENIIAEIYF